MPGLCGLISGPASQVAQNGLASVQNFAEDAVDSVNAASQDLDNFIAGLTPIDADITLEQAGNLSTPFQIMDKPELVELTFANENELDQKYNPAIGDPTFTKTAQSPGAFTKAAPELNLPGTPDDLTAEAPTSVPVVGNYPFPDAPTDEIPALPALTPIVIPAIPDLTLPEFTATEPSDLTEFAFTEFDWTEGIYTPTIRTEVVEQLQAILGGSTGIPTGIWDMILARMRNQLRNAAQQAKEEAADYWASRGHFLSNGQLRKRVDIAADTEREGVSDAVRELAIQDAKIYVERLNFAVAQGIALEGQLISLYNAIQDRSYQAAKAVYDIKLGVANYKITVYNARMEAYLQKAQIFKVIMDGELARLEETKIELEAQKLVGDLNLQKLEAYKAQITGITAVYQLFESQVRAVIAKYDADKVRVQAFAETVEVYKAQVSAWEAEWKGYAEAVRAQVARMDGYKAEADAFLSRVRAYEVGVQADKNVFDADIAKEKLKIEWLGTELERVRTMLQREAALVDIDYKINELLVRLYEAEGRIENSRVTSDAQRLDVLARNANYRMQAQIQETQMKITEAENIRRVQSDALQIIMQAQSQIGAAALAALNYAATISDSVSNSTSCSTSY